MTVARKLRASEMRPCPRCGRMKWQGALFCQCATGDEIEAYMAAIRDENKEAFARLTHMAAEVAARQTAEENPLASLKSADWDELATPTPLAEMRPMPTSASNFSSHVWEVDEARPVHAPHIALHLRICQRCGLILPVETEPKEPGEIVGHYVVAGVFPACPGTTTPKGEKA